MKVFEIMFRDENGNQLFKVFPAESEGLAVTKFALAFPDVKPEAIWDRTDDYITNPGTVFKALRAAGFSREKADIIAMLASSIK